MATVPYLSQPFHTDYDPEGDTASLFASIDQMLGELYADVSTLNDNVTAVSGSSSSGSSGPTTIQQSQNIFLLMGDEGDEGMMGPPGPAGASGAAGATDYQLATGSLSLSQVNAGANVQIVAGQGAGTVIVPIGLVLHTAYGNGFTTSETVSIVYGTNGTSLMGNTPFVARNTADQRVSVTFSNIAVDFVVATFDPRNQAVNFKFSNVNSGTPSGPAYSCNYYFTYYVITTT